jgi:hypothetical protein
MPGIAEMIAPSRQKMQQQCKRKAWILLNEKRGKPEAKNLLGV